MITCPSTSGVAWTGLATARPSLRHLDELTVFSFECPVCNTKHTWTRDDAWLDTEPEEEPAE